jgi:alpha-L-fucosidase
LLNSSRCSPFFYANATLDEGKTIEHNTSTIGYITVRVPDGKPLRSITLPDADAAIDIFALSLLEASTSGKSTVLTVQNVRSTTKWLNSGATGDERIQVVEVIVNNLAPLNAPISQWLTSPHNLTLSSDSLETVVPARIVRLRPNDQITVKVGVKARSGVKVGSLAKVTVKLVPDCKNCATVGLGGVTSWEIPIGIKDWTNDDTSLSTHEPPEWVSIFAHQPPSSKNNY